MAKPQAFAVGTYDAQVGAWRLPLKAATAIDNDSPAFWDEENSRVTDNPDEGHFIGCVVGEGAASGDPTCLVDTSRGALLTSAGPGFTANSSIPQYVAVPYRCKAVGGWVRCRVPPATGAATADLLQAGVSLLSAPVDMTAVAADTKAALVFAAAKKLKPGQVLIPTLVSDNAGMTGGTDAGFVVVIVPDDNT